MFAAKLFPLDQKVRIISQQDSDMLGMTDQVLLEVIRFRQDAIWRRSKNKLNRYWDSFASDQGADPFGPHSRVEIHVWKSLVGRWRMVVHWNPDDAAWAGMHLQLDFFLEWPLTCDAVF